MISGQNKIKEMKKVYLLLFAMGMFAFVACNQGTQETSTDVEEAVEEVVEEAAEAVTDESEMLAEHACNDKCTEDACHHVHGEKGHSCSDECEGEHPHGEGEEHQHDDGDEHPHSDDETTEG